MSRRIFLASLIASAIALPSTVLAAEICGNGLDDDADGLQDEGCYPAITTGVCESPLSCGVPRASNVSIRELTFA